MRRKIFSVLGVLPEPGGYAIAKFSRTPVYKSYQDWVMELTEEGAERFYDSFYFQYGHQSIADLGHVMVVFENISVPARNLLLDDQLIDVQSRSTRYVDYSKSRLILPPEIKKDKKLLALFKNTCQEFLRFYAQVSDKVANLYFRQYAGKKPPKMKEDEFWRVVRARSFDVSRYVLPCAIPKSMGLIASARTWERIITKFLSSDLLELQQIGKELQTAICKKQAFNPSLIKIEKAGWLNKGQKEQLKKLIAGKNIALPTLVKYAGRKEYPSAVYKKIKKIAPQLKPKTQPDGKRGVALFENINPELDLVATLFYRVLPHSYGQILKAVKAKGEKFWRKVINSAYLERGERDAVLREASTGQLTFDICVDIGAFRDLNRHRNCIQIQKEITPIYGFDTPKEIFQIGVEKEYSWLMKTAEDVFGRIEKKCPLVGQYVLPQAFKRRFLMRMTPWELQYITELRTRPQGHFSYREISYKMYQEFAKKYSSRAKHFRVVSPSKIDFFIR